MIRGMGRSDGSALGCGIREMRSFMVRNIVQIRKEIIVTKSHC